MMIPIVYIFDIDDHYRINVQQGAEGYGFSIQRDSVLLYTSSVDAAPTLADLASLIAQRYWVELCRDPRYSMRFEKRAPHFASSNLELWRRIQHIRHERDHPVRFSKN